MLYHHLKILHIILAAFLLISMAYSYYNRNHIIVITLALLQLIIGFTLISIQHEDTSQLWIQGSIIAFIIMIISWFGFILKYWPAIMLPTCVISLFSMVFFMSSKIS